MYVKFRNFHLNVLKIPKFSPLVRHGKYEKILKISHNVHNVFNTSYTLKPSFEPPGYTRSSLFITCSKFYSSLA